MAHEQPCRCVQGCSAKQSMDVQFPFREGGGRLYKAISVQSAKMGGGHMANAMHPVRLCKEPGY